MDIQVKPVEWFKPNKRNPRSHPPAQVEHLKASLEEFGLVQNVVALPDGTLLGGHGVVEAAKAAGLPTVDVQVVDLDETRANKLMVLLNEVSRLAVDDQAELASLLAELDAAGELPGTGYEAGEVEALLKSLEEAPTVTEDEPPELQAEAISKPGDLWLCGEGGHRVLCGDATVETDWVALFGSERARMVWTDPPYGVSYADKNEFLNALDRGNANQTHIANDHMSEADTETLCRDALSLAAAFGDVGASCYVACPAGTLLPHFIAAVAASGFTYKHSLAWVKQQFVLGRCDYHYKHETILYGWKTDGAHYFVDDHTKSSVFEVDKPHRSEEHPTMKPVELVAEMVGNSSRAGEIVADPFLGSGTTLIAAEQLGRRCYGMDIEPRYTDLAVRRWQKLTSKRATLESTGEPFPE